MKLISLVMFWRRNHLPSILFKSVVWGVLGWLAVGIFTSVETAVFGGLSAAILSGLKNSYRYFKERKALLKKVDGNKAQYKLLRAKMNTKGLGGGLITEMMRSELDDDDLDDEDHVVLSDEERAANFAITTEKVAMMKLACVNGGYVNSEQCEEAVAELLEDYSDGESTPDVGDLVYAFLPDNKLDVICEDFCNDDDHAGLMLQFAAATNSAWDPGECTSTYDEENERWSVNFFEKGEGKTWRFQQAGDWLNQKFLAQLVAYTQAQSGHIITVLDTEDVFEAVCLPTDLHNLLINQDQQEAA